MKIETNTLNVLKNFSTINPSIIIKEGKVLETISTSKTIMARAKVETEFPQTFALYNLNKFLSVLSLFNDPHVDFFDNYLTVSENDRKTNIVYSDPEAIVKPPEKAIKLPSVDVSVTITQEALKDVEKALGVLGLPEITITGNGDQVFLQAEDTKNPTGDVHSVVVGEAKDKFKAVFKAENIKVLPGTYTVEICSRGISRWSNDTVEYFVAVESSSTFE